MAGDVASLAAESPYISAAVGACGGAVLAKVRDDAADATVGLGRRLLQAVFGHRGEGERDAYTAGRDQTVVSYRRPDE